MNLVKTYKRLPQEMAQVIEAISVRDVTAAAMYEWSALPEWVTDAFHDHKLIIHPLRVEVHTMQGWTKAYMNDYLIREPFPQNGFTLYPCNGDVFVKTYKEA